MAGWLSGSVLERQVSAGGFARHPLPCGGDSAGDDEGRNPLLHRRGKAPPLDYVLDRPLPGKALEALALFRFGLYAAKRDRPVMAMMDLARALLTMVTPLATGAPTVRSGK